MGIGAVGYVLSAVCFGGLTLVLLRRRNARLGWWLALAAVASAAWAGFSAQVDLTRKLDSAAYQVAEVVRSAAWVGFLLMLASTARAERGAEKFAYRRTWAALGVFSASALGISLLPSLWPTAMSPGLFFLMYMGIHLLFPVVGLVLVEHLVRASDPRYLWEKKFLFFAVGGLLIYDLVLYSAAIISGGLSSDLWQARGYVNLLTVPLLAIAISRNRDWLPSVFVSRDVVFHSTALLLSGIYLVIVAAGGYYVSAFGGTWGVVAQVVLVSLALVLLAVVLFSSQLRAQLRVFLGKHFFQNKYDYRQEWLRLTTTLSARAEDGDKLRPALLGMSQLVDARAGMLWLADGERGFRNAAAWQRDLVEHTEPADSPLVRFLQGTGYVVTVPDVAQRREEYGDLVLPVWLATWQQAWLLVPIFLESRLLGFMVLGDPLVRKAITWEDRDLLKAAAQHVASHLAALIASEALAEARQFEAFNRLSAFMVHDLKNVAAELELVDRNAQVHRANPAFIDDAFDTVRNAAKDIRRMVDQFKRRRVAEGKTAIVDLGALGADVVSRMQGAKPAPTLIQAEHTCFVVADRDRLANVLRHLLDNAQQATPPEGFVRLRLTNGAGNCTLSIEDSGCGMDADFIRQRLFKPFDTTKGNAGMGIGMFESREFIRSLGGEIEVQSQLGKGTTVSLRIPTQQQDQHDQPSIATAVGC